MDLGVYAAWDLFVSKCSCSLFSLMDREVALLAEMDKVKAEASE